MSMILEEIPRKEVHVGDDVYVGCGFAYVIAKVMGVGPKLYSVRVLTPNASINHRVKTVYRLKKEVEKK